MKTLIRSQINTAMKRRPVRSPELGVSFFRRNRDRLKELLPSGSVAVLNANDILPTNADGTLRLQPNSDLFYLSGIKQEESILVLAPQAHDERMREVLFLREPNPHLATWEGHKLERDEAIKVSGITNIQWLPAFGSEFRRLMGDAEQVFLNHNEHKRACVEVETRELRFIRDCQREYPLHDFRRLAPLMHRLRVEKSEEEVRMIRHACQVTGNGLSRVLKKVKPGIGEHEVEAEFAHEFIRNHCDFAYTPIIAAGANSCTLHYLENCRECRSGDVLLLDVGARYGMYSSDLTRTIPVNGKFNRRQRQVYDAVLRVLRLMTQAIVPGKLHRDWQKEAEAAVERELVDLKLLTTREIRKQDPHYPAVKRFFMHGLGHPIGLDVHDVGFMHEPMAPGWVLTVEPGIYIPEEGFGVRLENTVVLTEDGVVNLMEDIPIEAKEIESLMKSGR
jgi:Xaa-Pro aminopeptidase